MAALTGVVAHGGTGGLVVELLLGLSVGGLFAAVWLRERRRTRRVHRRLAELRDDDDAYRDVTKPP